jgi:hypothetical protein
MRWASALERCSSLRFDSSNCSRNRRDGTLSRASFCSKFHHSIHVIPLTDLQAASVYRRVQTMKRRPQFVAILAMVLLAMQPCFAGLPCASGAPSSCARGCPMAMSGMGQNCPAHPMVAQACPQGCCGYAMTQAAVLPAAPEKSKAGTPTLSAARLNAVPMAFQAHPTGQRSFAVPLAPASRYILNHTFRI